ncbi:P-loop containing nucleoside triphosphate hydrolase protein [Piromyces finnis]|uniref:p-loop containing nucleoside triphosphate hydrolase protein n=1 Tax=Piromyces finnis TaxID=1754191 RepID=A0A1Y1V0I8_9FUNG|nr:P-loop containing nucleoside triphosphate hydrolase protein [Piromyces finnis]|eukprot:ORX44666.1 P-loop containing nucleoside triphosphate hydrolase protein [Piromyces finnis]
MEDISINEYKKIMIILRGLPGSGKSTLAKSLLNNYKSQGIILSSDDFFIENGVYKYDSSKIVDAHRFNQNRCREHCGKGTTPIIIDNTNVRYREAKVYIEMAIQYGYDIQVREPDTPWWKRRDVKELAKRTIHNVPEERIYKMLDRWNDKFFIEKK